MTEITVINGGSAGLEGSHYAVLLGGDWRKLPEAVRKRFGRPIAHGGARAYRGRVLATELSTAGRIVAWLARVVGGPMPFCAGAVGASMVAVTEVAGFGADGVRAQVWTRSYARPGAFPQLVQSAKCFTGPTGLEERLGYGLVMQLAVRAEGEAGAADLVFTSKAHLLRFGRLEVRLPDWLSPGHCEIRHRDEGGGAFTFTLTITHALLGRLVHQVARYRDVAEEE